MIEKRRTQRPKSTDVKEKNKNAGPSRLTVNRRYKKKRPDKNRGAVLYDRYYITK